MRVKNCSITLDPPRARPCVINSNCLKHAACTCTCGRRTISGKDITGLSGMTRKTSNEKNTARSIAYIPPCRCESVYVLCEEQVRFIYIASEWIKFSVGAVRFFPRKCLFSWWILIYVITRVGRHKTKDKWRAYWVCITKCNTYVYT